MRQTSSSTDAFAQLDADGRKAGADHGDDRAGSDGLRARMVFNDGCGCVGCGLEF